MTPSFYLSLIFLLVWILAKALYDFLRSILWRFNGIKSTLDRSYNKQLFSQCRNSSEAGAVAHVETILLRFTTDVLNQPSGLHNFITYHSGFVSTSHILSNPNVTLYNVNEKHAIFVETDGFDVYDLQKGGAFTRNSQYINAKKVITLPLWAFIALGKEVGHPKENLVFVPHSARCGSTLLMQVFHQTGKYRVISEPVCLQYVQEVKGKLDEDTVADVMEAVINTMCKPDDTSEAYIIKFPMPGIGNLTLMHKLYPQAKLIFSYRRGLDVVKSYDKIWQLIPFTWVFKWLGYYVEEASQILRDGFGIEDPKVSPQIKYTYHEIGGLIWAANVRFYLRHREALHIQGVRYEDMVNDTEYALKKVFDFLSLDYDSAAVERAFSSDSQIQTPISREAVAASTPLPLESLASPQMVARLRDMSDRFQVPDMHEDIVLPGTITHR